MEILNYSQEMFQIATQGQTQGVLVLGFSLCANSLPIFFMVSSTNEKLAGYKRQSIAAGS